MKNDGQKSQGGVPRSGRGNGFIPSSFRAISSYLRIVSSSASSVASTVRSAGASVATSIVDREGDANRNQVQWAGFDKLECEGDTVRQVLLLGYQSGFQVWDVEEADNVHELVSRYDGPVSFLQMQPKPTELKMSEDKLAEIRPLLVVAGGVSLSRGGNGQDGLSSQCNGNATNSHEFESRNFVPTVVRFFSLRSQSYVHVLKFKSAVCSVRCSPRLVAISQASQIHCFSATTLEREYTILTHPIVSDCLGPGGIGYGPLAVGPRWLAYSGSPVVVPTGRVSPKHLAPAASFSGSPSNGSLVAHYAKESTKQLAAGIVILGDTGYKKLSRYCSEILPDRNNSLRTGSPGRKNNGTINGHLPDTDIAGMVIVRDIVYKSVITQFRAHKSPISALCFDPSGTLLVTASVQGHNINVFRIMPTLTGSSSGSDGGGSYIHLYRLQRGFTNAVIQDISFSEDSHWIMISSSRGTSHLFAISPSGGSINPNSTDASFTNHRKEFCTTGPPVTLSVVSRIKNGNNGWRGTLSSLSGAIASSFHYCRHTDLYRDTGSLKRKYHLLVFSPSGCLVQYVLHLSTGLDFSSGTTVSPVNTCESAPDIDGKFLIEALRKWDISQRQNHREKEGNIDIYGEHGNGDSSKIFPEGIKRGNGTCPTGRGPSRKVRISAEERHHLYISEAELQMHQARIPLWAKSEICSQLLMTDCIKTEDWGSSGGEIEIERIPTRMIETRSKYLVPVIDYLQTPKFQHSRLPAIDNYPNGPLLHRRSGLSEDGIHSCRSSRNSLDCMSEDSSTLVKLPNGIEENGLGSLQMSMESSKDFVNKHDNLNMKKAPFEFVNTRESPIMYTHLEFVNNNQMTPKMAKNHIDGIENELG